MRLFRRLLRQTQQEKAQKEDGKLMLFRAQYAMIPGRLLPPGFGFAEADLCISSRRFRMKIETETRHDEIDEPYLVTFVGAVLRKDPPPEVAEIFADPEGFKKEHEERRPGADPDDLFATTVRFPENYWDFVRQVARELDEQTEALFATLSWRLGVRGEATPFETDPLRLYCLYRGNLEDADPLEHGQWSHLPHGMRVGFDEDPEFVPVPPETRVDIEELFAASALPLGHELLQEAWRLVESSPRSALVTAVAAAETRIKELIIRLQPQTNWLALNAPSPPVVKMVKDYLAELEPEFRGRRKVGSPPKSVRRALNDAIKERNALAHGKGRQVNLKDLGEWLRKIEAFLFLCDYYEGHEWALERVSPEVRAELGLEEPDDQGSP